MLTSVFIGRENIFNLVFLNWLATQSDLKAIIWADTDRYTRAGRRRWLKRSLKRDGLFTTLDRMRFTLWLNRSQEVKAGMERMCRDIKQAYPCEGVRNRVSELWTGSLKTRKVDQLLNEVNPNVIIVNCISQLISKQLCRLPSHGLYIYHEGITPEYKGVHSPLWAIANGEDDKVGYTLLKADETFDGGEVYVQGQTSLDPLATSLGYTGHWTQSEGFPQIGEFLRNLDEGCAKPKDTSSRSAGYYSYFTYTRLKDIKKRRKERGLCVRPDDVVFR